MAQAAGAPDQLVGAVLNQRWRLVKLLGEGGMGAVYEADGVHGEGKRAIKLLHREFVSEQQIVQRFFAEAQACRNLRHPNIAAIFEAATAEDGTPYLVMELLTGIPLATYLEAGHPIPVGQAAPILFGVLSALSVAHAQRVVHRDLKPDNLFLVRDAAHHGAFVTKVLDFGIAKVMDAAGGMGSKTRTGMLLGTPGYMSPEQIKNSKAVDPRSDLWSVGIILYEMLTAKAPFHATTEFGRLTAVLTEEITPVEQHMPNLAPFAPFFQRALAKDPARRFQSADEMAHALHAVMHSGAMPNATAEAATVAIPAVPSMIPSAPGGSPSHVPGSIVPLPPQPLSTQMSGQRPTGVPTVSEAAPQVHVVPAPALPQAGVPPVLVALIGLICVGLGFIGGWLAHP